MILEDILCDIKNSLEGTGYFSTVYEFAEMTKTKTESTDYKTRGTVSGVSETLEFPRYYIGNGQYKDLFDLEKNTGYIRKVSSASVRELRDITQSCDSNILLLEYPMRFVFAVHKDLLEDNAFSDEKMIYEVLEVLGGRISNIANTRKVYVKPERYETDRNRVWSEEVKGMEEIIRVELVYAYIDFRLEVEVNRDCLIDTCYG